MALSNCACASSSCCCFSASTPLRNEHLRLREVRAEIVEAVEFVELFVGGVGLPLRRGERCQERSELFRGPA